MVGAFGYIQWNLRLDRCGADHRGLVHDRLETGALADLLVDDWINGSRALR